MEQNIINIRSKEMKNTVEILQINDHNILLQQILFKLLFLPLTPIQISNNNYIMKIIQTKNFQNNISATANGQNQNSSLSNINPRGNKQLPNLSALHVNYSSVNSAINPPTKFKKPRKIPPGYQLADFNRTLEHWNKLSYSKLRLGQDQSTQYSRFSLCSNLDHLKDYGLGIYLYLQFMKRLFIVFLILSALMVYPLYANFTGTALSTYKSSFSIILARFTIGNLDNADRAVYIAESCCDIVGMIVLFVFYLRWRHFHNNLVLSYQKDINHIDPRIYVVSVVGFDPKTPKLETALKKYFEQHYGGIYEVEVVYDFERKFVEFIEYEKLLEKLEKEKQVIKQTEKNNQDLLALEKIIQEKQEKLAVISTNFEPLYAIIHFQSLKGKHLFIQNCESHELVNRTSSSIKRCLFNVPQLQQTQKFNRRDNILLDQLEFPRPQAINWDNIDISAPSYICRLFISILLIIISIFVTSSMIALCTLYVSSRSNCSSYDSNTTLEEAQVAAVSNNELTVFCYCSSHIIDIFQDAKVETLCQKLNTQIFVSNIVQIAASLLSTVTNVILIMIVGIVPEKILKPKTKQKQHNFIFISVFLSNLINSTILPLILNGDIYGFKSITYLNFINFIKFENVLVFDDFDRNWFAVISPYYTNFFIISMISPLIEVLIYAIKRKYILWKVRKQCENKDPKEPTIQKQADELICMFPIDLPVEIAAMTLQIFMCYMYSCLIPLAIPIFTIGLFLSLVCKKYIILNYTKRIPADEAINKKVIRMLPFIILFHGLMAIWGRTAEGIYMSSAFVTIPQVNSIQHQIPRRGVTDLMMLCATGVIGLWIIIDHTFIYIVNFCKKICRNELEIPQSYISLQNIKYGQRIKKSNIIGSYKLTNHPVYKHPYNAFLQLVNRMQSSKARSEIKIDIDLNQMIEIKNQIAKREEQQQKRENAAEIQMISLQKKEKGQHKQKK